MLYLNFLKDELTAILLNKYKIQSTLTIFEDAREWRIQKPHFYLQIFTPREAPIYNTIFIAELGYFKITRRA
jgi:hypothetical protein